MSELARLEEVFYGSVPHPNAIRLTVDQARRINAEMHPAPQTRIAIGRHMRLLMLDTPVEWVDHEEDSTIPPDFRKDPHL